MKKQITGFVLNKQDGDKLAAWFQQRGAFVAWHKPTLPAWGFETVRDNELNLGTQAYGHLIDFAKSNGIDLELRGIHTN